MLTDQNVLDTLHAEGLWGINYHALNSALERRYGVDEDQARHAIDQASRSGAVVINRLGEVRRPQSQTP